MINDEVTARTYMELTRLEKVLNGMGIDTNLVRKSEEFELNVLVAVLDPDEQGRERFINFTFMPLPEDEIEYVDLLQLYTSFPVSPTAVAPCRLERRFPSVPRMRGTWAKAGTGRPRASKRRICLGVLERWSSPRSTRLMPMSLSSETTARL